MQTELEQVKQRVLQRERELNAALGVIRDLEQEAAKLGICLEPDGFVVNIRLPAAESPKQRCRSIPLPTTPPTPPIKRHTIIPPPPRTPPALQPRSNNIPTAAAAKPPARIKFDLPRQHSGVDVENLPVTKPKTLYRNIRTPSLKPKIPFVPCTTGSTFNSYSRIQLQYKRATLNHRKPFDPYQDMDRWQL